jgi:hypothetical protein
MELLFELADQTTPSLYITPGGTHNPARDTTDDFICAMNSILQRADEKDEPICFHRPFISDEAFEKITNTHGWSVFDAEITRSNIQKLYSSIREAFHDVSIDQNSSIE